MKILVTGATGYVGKKLIPVLVEGGHHVIALVRNRKNLSLSDDILKKTDVIEGDLLKKESLQFPKDIDAAYYLVHSMSDSLAHFEELETLSANNFVAAIENTNAKQVIYLSGLVNEKMPSAHLQSRFNVENILKKSRIPHTVLRAGIIIGPGSASFQIINDLVKKLPIMIAPKWVSSLCQPIGIDDMIFYLTAVLDRTECKNRVFDVGGPEKLSYKEMLLEYAKFRGLHRLIISVPVLTPRLSSYWLYFVTSTNLSLAMALVDSLKSNAVCKETSIQEILPHRCLSYKECLKAK
jgi:uncharacterized protein YbjT (DUF2867 family)